MQKAATVPGVTHSVVNVTACLRTITGELGAGKLARSVREEADGKGPVEYLASCLLHSYGRRRW
jgi:hypothetical protein